MIRRILFDVLLFLLPFAIYGLYWRFSAKGSVRAAAHPWNYLLISGLVLVAASFVFWGVTEGAGQQGNYVPARVENGRVIPGHVEAPPNDFRIGERCNLGPGFGFRLRRRRRVLYWREVADPYGL